MNILLLDGIDARLESNLTLAWVSLGAVAFYGMLMFATFFYIQYQFYKQKVSFTDSFLRINEQQVELFLQNVKSFEQALVEEQAAEKIIGILRGKTEGYGGGTGKKGFGTGQKSQNEMLKYKTKPASMSGVHRVTLLGIFIGILICILNLMPFILIGVFSDETNQLIKDAVTEILNLDTILYESSLSLTQTYEYIDENITTLTRGQNIEDDLLQVIASMRNAQLFLQNLESSGIHDQVPLIIKGDLCSLVEIPSYLSSTECEEYADGVLLRGLTGMHSFIIFAISQSKGSFDSSARDTAAKQEILAIPDLIQTEGIFFYWATESYRVIRGLFHGYIQDTVDDSQLKTLYVLIIGIFILSVPALFIWIKMKKLIKKERSGWSKIIRQIPVHIILDNKLLTHYLVKNSGEDGEFIKRYI